MGIIRAALNAVGGGLADSWLEVIEPSEMDITTVFAPGVAKAQNDRRNTNHKGSPNLVSNGSIIHVYDHQLMILVDGGAIIDYTAEPGYFQVQNSSMPSLFNGQFGDSLRETFNRIRFGGITPSEQRVFYINTQEMTGIKFGTKMPINYYDSNYNLELNVRAFGTYSVKLENPLEFYRSVIPTGAVTTNQPVDISILTENNYISEFLGAFQQAITELSMEGVRISQLGAKSLELADHMSKVLDEKWRKNRGMYIQEVGIANISYDDESKEILKMRNQGAVLSDPTIREGYVQGAVARGLENAGSNANGAMAGFVGMGMGMNAGGGFMGAASATNMQQYQMQQAQQTQQVQTQQPANNSWTCTCGHTGNTGKFCAECGNPKPVPMMAGAWTCPGCGTNNTGKFCAECGARRPESRKLRCDKCGFEPDMSQPIPKFCPNCGDPINENDYV